MPRFSSWIKDTVLRRTTVVDTDLIALVTESPVGAAIEVGDLLTGRVQSDDLDHLVVMPSSEYNDPGFTPDPRTGYWLTA